MILFDLLYIHIFIARDGMGSITFNKSGFPEIDPETMQTNLPNVWVGGDLTGTSYTTVEAVNDGKQAAWHMHRYLQVLRLIISFTHLFYLSPYHFFYSYSFLPPSPSLPSSLCPSLPPSVSPSVPPSIPLSLPPSLCPSLYPSVPLSLPPSVPLSLPPSVSPSLPPSVSPSVSLSLCVHVSVSVSVSVSLSSLKYS